MITQSTPNIADDLQSLVGYLKAQYYDRLKINCESVTRQVALLNNGDAHQANTLYISLCKKMTTQIGAYMRLRRLALVPYIQELAEKEDTGHDCRSCASSCAMRHMEQIKSVRDAHAQIRTTLNLLTSIEAPLAHQSLDGPAYEHLRGEIVEMDSLLTALFSLENAMLIPKMIEAQKAIYIHPAIDR